jgi:hypothetical protein
MASEKNSLAHVDNETQITLGLLNPVHENSSVTQCSVAKELGIALGFANNYLKRCVNKVPSRQQLTVMPTILRPMGFAEKSQLTARYLTMSFDFPATPEPVAGMYSSTVIAQAWVAWALPVPATLPKLP